MKAIFLLLAIIISLTINAATWYISPTGNDDTGDGSISTPYFTLNKVWTVIGAGDTVYLRGGTYAFNTQQSLTGKNGTSGNLINVFAYPSESPILTKSGSYTQTDGRGIFFTGNYIHWKGIEITGFVQINANAVVVSGLSSDNASYCIFENLRIHGNGNGMNLTGNSGKACTGNLFLNCDFYENQDPLTSGSPYGNADGLSISWVSDVSSINTVRGCRFWWNSDDGVDFYNNDGFVLIENCQAFYNGFIPNTFIEAGDGMGIKFGDSWTDQSTVHMRTAKNCIAIKNKRNGFAQNGLYGLVKLYNCTSYQNTGSIAIGIHLADFALAHTVVNCITYSNSFMDQALGANTIQTTNSWQNGITVSNADFASVNQSLLLTARQSDGSLPLTNFLRLVTGSDLVNTGTVVSGIDYVGIAPDLGAYEYDPELPLPPNDNRPRLIMSRGKYTISSKGEKIVK